MTAEEPKQIVETDAPRAQSGAMKKLSLIVRILLLVIVVGGGATLAWYWLANRPPAKRRRPKPRIALVEAVAVRRTSEPVVIRAMGTVVPARSIQLTSRVSGEIIKVESEFVPGGRFAADADILRIEPWDYLLAAEQRDCDLTRAKNDVAKAGSGLIKAENDLKIEMGRQSMAADEFALLKGQVEVEGHDKDLLLRKPQLAIAQANVATAKSLIAAAEASVTAARAALDKATLDWLRTTVVAPFNATVQTRHVNRGSTVAVGTPLASLVGTDEYWIQVTVPVNELRRIQIPGTNGETGSTVHICDEAAWGPGAGRSGTVSRLMTDLEPAGRMARLLVTVKDPLALNASAGKRPALILGAFVRVRIIGTRLPNVLKIPRAALRDGNRIWIMKPNGKLDIRNAAVCWSDNDHVYMTDKLAPGERLIVSNLPAPVAGMTVRTKGAATRPAGKPKTGGKGNRQ